MRTIGRPTIRERGGVTLCIATLCACAAICTTTVVHADDLRDFERARRAYEDASYRRAASMFEALVGGEVPRIRNPALILESRKYLGASYLLLRRTEDAERQFGLLLQEDSSYRLDPVRFPKAVQETFDRVRARVEREQKRAEAEAARREEAQRRAELRRLAQQNEQLRQEAQGQTTEHQNSRLVATIPFGVGQLQNQHRNLGLTLAIVQGILAAGSLATFWSHWIVRRRDVPEVDQDRFRRLARSLRISNQTITGTLAAIMLAGIIDAHVRFRPRVSKQRDSARGSGGVHVDHTIGVGPGAFQWRVRF